MRLPVYVPVAILLAACTRAPALSSELPAASASTTPVAPVAVASATPSASVAAPAAPPAAPCVHPAYQPTLCLNADGPLDEAASHAWFGAHGATVDSSFPGYPARCTEIRFGAVPGGQADAIPTLACTVDEMALGPLGGNGPIGTHRDLRILGVRDGKVFEFGRFPIALSEAGHWDGETLFAAHYAIDPATSTVTLTVPAEDCAAGRKGVTTYHTDWIAPVADQPELVNARRAQIRLDLLRINRTCKAAGTYTLAKNGRLALTP